MSGKTSTEQFREDFTRRRELSGFSQRGLAEKTGYTNGFVSQIESGRSIPSGPSAQDLDDALQAGGEIARLAAEARQEKQASTKAAKALKETLAAMNRRRMLALGLTAATTVPMLAMDHVGRIASAVTESLVVDDASLVDWLAGKLTACYANDGSGGPLGALPDVLGLLATIEPSASRVGHGVHDELLSIGAHGAEFAAWLYHDAGVPSQSNHWLDKATEWALRADNTAMQGYVLLKKSQNAWGSRDAPRMLSLAQVVQRGNWNLPARVQAEAAQQEARGHAMLGADPRLVERKLNEAFELLNGNDTDDDPQQARLSPHYNDSLLKIQAAICYCEAGQPELALATYENTLNASTFARRDYGYFQSLMCSAFIAAKQPEDAIRVGIEALSVAVPTASARTLQELSRVTDDLKPWARKPAVADFRDHVRSYAASITPG